MRRVNDDIDTALADSGVLKKIDEALWNDKGYAYDGEEAETLSDGFGNSMSDKSEDQAVRKASMNADASEEVSEAMELSAQHQRLKYLLEKAHDDLGEHRGKYKEYLDEYLQDQQSGGRTESYEKLAEEFMARDMTTGQRLVARIKHAE
jgi:hypothetical protein